MEWEDEVSGGGREAARGDTNWFPGCATRGLSSHLAAAWPAAVGVPPDRHSQARSPLCASKTLTGSQIPFLRASENKTQLLAARI